MPRLPITLMTMQLGGYFVTRKAARRLNSKDAMDSLERHLIGDYGDVDDFDWKTNDLAWEHGFPVVSSYVDRKKTRFLIITEADRSATTILLPDEY